MGAGMTKTVTDYADLFAASLATYNRIIRAEADYLTDRSFAHDFEMVGLETVLEGLKNRMMDQAASSLKRQAGSFADLQGRLRLLNAAVDAFGADHPLVGELAAALARDNQKLAAATTKAG
jgi:hypothetical protein